MWEFINAVKTIEVIYRKAGSQNAYLKPSIDIRSNLFNHKSTLDFVLRFLSDWKIRFKITLVGFVDM